MVVIDAMYSHVKIAFYQFRQKTLLSNPRLPTILLLSSPVSFLQVMTITLVIRLQNVNIEVVKVWRAWERC